MYMIIFKCRDEGVQIPTTPLQSESIKYLLFDQTDFIDLHSTNFNNKQRKSYEISVFDRSGARIYPEFSYNPPCILSEAGMV